MCEVCRQQTPTKRRLPPTNANQTPTAADQTPTASDQKPPGRRLSAAHLTVCEVCREPNADYCRPNADQMPTAANQTPPSRRLTAFVGGTPNVMPSIVSLKDKTIEKQPHMALESTLGPYSTTRRTETIEQHLESLYSPSCGFGEYHMAIGPTTQRPLKNTMRACTAPHAALETTLGPHNTT